MSMTCDVKRPFALLKEGAEELSLAKSNHADLTTTIMKTKSEIEKMELQRFSLEKQLSKRGCRGGSFRGYVPGIR